MVIYFQHLVSIFGVVVISFIMTGLAVAVIGMITSFLSSDNWDRILNIFKIGIFGAIWGSSIIIIGCILLNLFRSI